MKKTLRVFTVLSIVASSILFATPSQAATFVCGSTGTYTVTNGILTNTSNCSGTITIDSSVHTIGNHSFWFGAFGGPSNIVIPSSVTLIEDHAFYHITSNIISITLPDNIAVELGFFSYEAFPWNGSATIYYCGTVSSTLQAITLSGSPTSCIPTTSAPLAPASVTATATGKRSATISFAAPSSNGGSAVSSYTVTSSPGGITKTLNQAGAGTFTFDNLQPSTSYTFAVTAKNAIGTSTAATSNSIKTLALDVASLSALSFADDGTGTGGKIIWAGKNVDAVLYTGPASSYPGPYNYGAFSGGWNGRIRNLTSDTSYTVSIYAVSADGVGESKSLTFKTSAALPALLGAANATTAQTDSSKLSQMITWINENTFNPGEAANMTNLLTKFMAIETSPHRSFVKVPTSRVSKVVATSLTPNSCRVENQGIVTALSADTCTISYTVSGGSKALATMVKDFVFKKVTK